MSVRWTEADIRKMSANLRAQIATPCEIRSKYGNKRVRHGYMKFDSQHEFEVYRNFELQALGGEIRSVIRQVSMPLPKSDRRMRIDFMVIEKDGRVRWIDAKGFATEAWKLKRDVVQQAYGITIETC